MNEDGVCAALTREIIGAAIEVHKALGPRLLESAYEACLCHELGLRGISYERQLEVPIEYKGLRVGTAFRLDLIVERQVIVEIKAADKVIPINEAQLLTYLKLTNTKVGLIINFNTKLLTDGVKRLVL